MLPVRSQVEDGQTTRAMMDPTIMTEHDLVKSCGFRFDRLATELIGAAAIQRR